jgi:hypothetical protein
MKGVFGIFPFNINNARNSLLGLLFLAKDDAELLVIKHEMNRLHDFLLMKATV